jgi:hypothetical protein
MVDLTSDIRGFNELLDKPEKTIAINFGTPRFLLRKPIENKIAACAELEAYV